MSVWVIIPVKPLGKAKSRLSPALPPEARRQLAEDMMRHVITTARRAPQVKGVLVISRDTTALAIARLHGAQTVLEGDHSELNSALLRATAVAAERGGASVLILPADLPLLSADDIAEIVRRGDDLTHSRSIVIAPDHDEDGTNALFIRPPGLIAYGYGVGSFRRHIAYAEQVGAEVAVYRSPRLALDIDNPPDLARYAEAVTASGEPATIALPQTGENAAIQPVL